MPGWRYTVSHIGTGYLGWENAPVLVVGDVDTLFPCVLGANLLAQQDIVINWGRGQIYSVGAPSIDPWRHRATTEYPRRPSAPSVR